LRVSYAPLAEQELSAPLGPKVGVRPFRFGESWKEGLRLPGHFHRALAFGALLFAIRYRTIATEAAKISTKHALLDGEMVVQRPDGTCDYWALQKDVRNGVSERLTFFAFDILFHDHRDMRRLPLLEREELRRQVLSKRSLKRIRYVEHFEADGLRFGSTPTKSMPRA
jgi:hypothetical protein